MRGVRTGGAHDYKVDCPSPSIPLVYVSRSLFEVGRGSRLRLRWRLRWKLLCCFATPLQGGRPPERSGLLLVV